MGDYPSGLKVLIVVAIASALIAGWLSWPGVQEALQPGLYKLFE